MSKVCTLTDLKQKNKVDSKKVVQVIKLLDGHAERLAKDCQNLFEENQRLETQVEDLKKGGDPVTLEMDGLSDLLESVANKTQNRIDKLNKLSVRKR